MNKKIIDLDSGNYWGSDRDIFYMSLSKSYGAQLAAIRGNPFTRSLWRDKPQIDLTSNNWSYECKWVYDQTHKIQTQSDK